MTTIDVKIKKVSDTATIPTYGTANAACCDLYADLKGEKSIIIKPFETVKVGTGCAYELPESICAYIFARSGLSTKNGLRPANCVGVCDSDYRGEYIVALHNDTNIDQVVEHGMRIAQVMFVPVYIANFTVVNELSTTERGSGGFGSTGK